MGEYPCVGIWGFLRNRCPQVIETNEGNYEQFVERIRNGASVLDVGCCFGQDLRRLAFESGALTEHWYATDLNRDLWDIGYDMFRDKNRMKATFITGDILADENPLWKLDKRFDVILLSQLLHLFNWEQNVRILKQLVSISKPGCQLLGYQASGTDAHERKTQWGNMFSHNVDSFTKLWEQVGRETGSLWTVKVRQLPYPEFEVAQGFINAVGPAGRALLFIVTREQQSSL
jgi:SAM-dependent methyltransferase